MAAKSNNITAVERGGAKSYDGTFIFIVQNILDTKVAKEPFKQRSMEIPMLPNNVSFGWHDGTTCLLSGELIFQHF